jgi:hypothetical protein
VLSAPALASFAPSFSATTRSNKAGQFSPLTISVSRSDQDETIGQISVQLPPGVVAAVRSVRPCVAAEAETGACPAASKIGHLGLGAGSGATPVALPAAGRPEDPIYLTGPYKGAPFGLSMLVHGEAGPPSIAQVVVRAAIEVDPLTAQMTLASDPLPSALQSAAFDLRSLTLVLDRPKLVFNPTSCEALHSTATILSTAGILASVTSPFQATDCGALAFHPSFSVSASGKTSKLDGASLYVKIVDRQADAVAAEVKADLPRQLPARLATLDKACPHTTFESNPADCDPDSRVGFARLGTQVLAGDLSGPALLVSYGNAQFPELVIVLQGEGVRIDLHGTTFINSAGITSSTFAALPDLRLRFFELTLPEGPDSALSAPEGLCGVKLKMPNTFVGENGAVLNRATPIKVSGCPSRPKSRMSRSSTSRSAASRSARRGRSRRGRSARCARLAGTRRRSARASRLSAWRGRRPKPHRRCGRRRTPASPGSRRLAR